MAKVKFYAVKKGFKTGVFTSWNEAKELVTGYPGADYKSFTNEDVAPIDEADLYNIYVDGSFKEDLNAVGYGIVVTKDDVVLFKDGGRVAIKDTTERNVIGEIYASIRSIQLAIVNGYKNICICYDYEGIEKWATGAWKAKKPITKRYVEYFNQHKDKLNIKFKHVYGHTGNIYNEEADRIAKLGCEL